MISFRNVAALTFVLAVLGATAAPTYARDAARAVDRVDGADANHLDAARSRALEECTKLEQKYNQMSWGTTQIQAYRSCMAEHHQAE
jgi:DnaJ-domain-containing protein 1